MFKQVSVESAGMLNLNTDSAETGRATPTPCAPGARAWESRITDFYRQWEIRRNEEKNQEGKLMNEGKREKQHQKVRNFQFARSHGQREEAIRHAAKRLDMMYDHKEYKQNIQCELDIQDEDRQERCQQIADGEQERRRRAGHSKKAREAANAFVAQRHTLEKTCRRIDLWKTRLQDKAEAAHRAEQEKEQRAACSARHASHRALEEAQKRKVDAQLRRKEDYLHKLALDKVKDAEAEIRDRVAAERDLMRAIKDHREELESIRAESAAGLGGDAIENYEHTIASLRELAKKVKVQSEDLVSSWQADPDDPDVASRLEQTQPAFQPMPDALPRVSAALSGGALGRASPVEDFLDLGTSRHSFQQQVEYLESQGVRAFMEDESTPWPMPCAPMMDSPSPRGISTSRSASRPCTARTEPSPLLVRPLVDLHQQVGIRTARAPKKGNSRPSSQQSLAALRRIRRTGPLVKR
jgi:hypothetical protein